MLAWALGLPFGIAVAAQPAWLEQPYPYMAVNQDVRAALREFGSNKAVSVQISERVRGRVQHRMPSATARQFLDAVALDSGLEWYFDGRVLHISDVEEARLQMLPLRGMGFAELQAALEHLDIADPRYPLKLEQGGKVVLVAGPPAYVDLVQDIVDAFAMRAEPAEVIVIHGRSPRNGNP